jgi:hypothetical protein
MGNDIPAPPGSLSTGGKLWEGLKHVGKKAIKGAIIGGIIGAVALAAGGFLLGGLFALIPGVGVALSTLFVALGSTFGVTAGAVGGAVIGAKIGGLIGAASGVAGADEAIQEADDRGVANTQRAEDRAMKMAAVGQSMGEKQLALAQRAQEIEGQSLPGARQGMGGREA